MLNKLDCQLTNAQMSQFFVSKKYTDYFNIQQTLSDLVNSKFIEKTVIRNTSYYNITPEGYEALAFFKNQIPAGALKDVDEFLEVNRFALKNEVGTIANYYKHTTGDYIAHGQVTEGKSTLFEVDLSLPTEEDAKRACDNWAESSESIYAYLMKTLLR